MCNNVIVKDDNRFLYIDYAKVVAIFLVLVYHSHLQNFFNYAILSLCVPIFFVVNGYLMLRKNRSWNEIWKKNIKLLFLIIFWGFFQTIVRHIFNSDTISFKSIFFHVYFLSKGYSNHLWFLIVIFVLNFFNPIIKIIIGLGKKSLLFIICALSLCTLIGFSKIIWFFNPFNGWYWFSLVYYLLGFFIFEYKFLWKKISTYLIAVFFFTNLLLQTLFDVILMNHESLRSFLNIEDLVFSGYSSIFTVFATISFIMLLYRIRLKNFFIIDFISKNTLGIYLIHGSVLSCLLNIDFLVRHFYLLPIVLLFASCFICWLLNKCKQLRFFIKL